MTMNKELLLHIGCHKTGTTTFQYWLQENSKYLSENGYYFPSELAFEGHNHSLLAMEMNGQDGDYPNWNLLFAGMLNCPIPKYIISSEDFVDLSELNVKRLSDLLKSRFDSIRIYATVRHPHRAVVSHWGLLLKQGYVDSDFASFVTNGYFAYDPLFDLKKYNYEFILKPWIQNFGREKITLIPYMEEQDSLGPIIKALGIKLDNLQSFAQLSRRNKSPNRRCLSTMLFCNRVLRLNNGLSPERKRVIAGTVYAKAKEMFKESAEKFNPIDKHALRILTAYYFDSIEWLKSNFDVTFQPNPNNEQPPLDRGLDALSIAESVYWHRTLVEHMEYVDSSESVNISV